MRPRRLLDEEGWGEIQQAACRARDRGPAGLATQPVATGSVLQTRLSQVARVPLMEQIGAAQHQHDQQREYERHGGLSQMYVLPNMRTIEHNSCLVKMVVEEISRNRRTVVAADL